MNAAPLTGRTIAVPETRELDLFAALLERRGATVLRCPLVAIRDAEDPAPVLQFVRRFNDGACDDLILLTGEGLLRILSCIEQHAPALKDPFVARLGRVRKITRGPKPARALRNLGLKPDLIAEAPTTAGVIETLKRIGVTLQGHVFGVQLYGGEPNRPLVEFLQSVGAGVITVAPYRYADAADDEAVQALLTKLGSGAIDAIAFTSMQQVRRLFDVGADAAAAALARTQVAAVGPLVAAALEARGVAVRAMPGSSYFLKPLASALEEALGATSLQATESTR